MQYIHNDSILATREISTDNFRVRYMLFESSQNDAYTYSAMISLFEGGNTKEDYYIPNLAQEAPPALVLFEKLYRNTVLPCEVEAIYSDGFADYL
jgi:hypothetical protein